MKLNCTVIEIGEPVTFDSGFRKQTVRVEGLVEDQKFPGTYDLQIHKEKVDETRSLGEGTKILAHVDVRGRLWNDRVFHDLVMWDWSVQGENPNLDRSTDPIPNQDPKAAPGGAQGASACPIHDDEIPF